MTTTKQTATEFEEIIQRGRRQKNQDLAHQLLGGGGRRASGSGVGQGLRRPGTGPTLASRVGIVKRSTSQSSQPSTAGKKPQSQPASKPAGNVDADWTHDLHETTTTNASRGAKFNNRGLRGGMAGRADRLNKAFTPSASSTALSNQFNVVNTTKQSNGISIRGLAGPSVVMAENFAPGTSAPDIESAMTPIGGTMLKCSIVTSGSAVSAELVFQTREGADSVISTFDNQIADGRVLRLYHKPPSVPTIRSESAPIAAPVGPRADYGNGRSDDTRSSARYGASDRYEPREQSRERLRSYEREDVVDGSFGFEEPMDTDEPSASRADASQSRGLYSDTLVNRRGDRDDRGSWRDGRNRGRGGDRGQRGRGYR